MVTLKFLSEKAGVSMQTVSNVLNNKTSEVGEKKRQQILDLIKQYNYTPNRAARSLKLGSTGTISLIVPDIIEYPFFSEVFNLIEEIFSEKEFNILLFDTRESKEREKKAIGTSILSNVDGIIIIRVIEKNEYQDLFKTTIPVVGCVRNFNLTIGPAVLTDNFVLGFKATEYLIKKGHKKILHICGDFNLEAHIKRFEGYKAALKENKLFFDPKKVFTINYKDPDIGKILFNSLNEIKDYTAIFAYTDVIALEAIKVFKSLGINVPKDVSIIGVDNLNIGKYSEPTLTSICQPIREICRKSADLLISSMEDKSLFKKTFKNYYFEPHIVEKNSVQGI